MNSNPIRYRFELDGIVKREERGILANPSRLSTVINRVADSCGMTILNLMVSNIKEDLSKLHKEVFEDEGGVSVVALISTSHIALHGWPNRRRFMLDVVSCRSFSTASLYIQTIADLCVETVVHYDVHPKTKLTISNTSDSNIPLIV